MEIYERIIQARHNFYKVNFQAPDSITLGYEEYNALICSTQWYQFVVTQPLGSRKEPETIMGMTLRQSRKPKYFRIYKKGYPKRYGKRKYDKALLGNWEFQPSFIIPYV
jgi:hypothetical protein